MQHKGWEDERAIVFGFQGHTLVAFPKNQRTSGVLLRELLHIIDQGNKTIGDVVPSCVLMLFVEFGVAVSGYHGLLPCRVIDNVELCRI
jgi:hypothetical protein